MDDSRGEYKMVNMLESDCEDIRDIGSVMVVCEEGCVCSWWCGCDREVG